MKFSKAVLLASSVFVLAACGSDKEPEECTKYFATVNACMDKLAKDNPTVGEQMKKTMDEQKKAMFENEAFKKLDSKQQGLTCKAAEDAFKQNAGAIGC